MSRFWAAGGSSSESESDDDSYSSSGSSAGPRQAENRWADLSDESGAFFVFHVSRGNVGFFPLPLTKLSFLVQIPKMKFA
jgi:hypothetical protein